MTNRDDQAFKVFVSNRRKIMRHGMLNLLLGALCAFLAWTSKDGLTKYLLLIYGLFLVPIGVIGVFSALLNLPHIRASPEGLTFKSVWRTISASWDSLSEIELVTRVDKSNTFTWLVADIVGPNVSPNLRGASLLKIEGEFQRSMPDIWKDLCEYQAQFGAPKPAVPVPKDDAFGVENFTRPWLTYSLLAMLIAAYCAEQIWALTDRGGWTLLQVPVPTLIALGGMNYSVVVANGDWHRFFTAPLLHGGIFHLLLNGFALLSIGQNLERFVGRVWFVTIYLVCGFVGATASFFINPPNVTSIGASGAIVGLFATALIVSRHLPARSELRDSLHSSWAVLVASLAPVVVAGTAIDFAGHAGGALAGTLIGVVLLRTWPNAERLPRFKATAGLIGLIALVCTLIAVAVTARNYADYADMSEQKTAI